MSDSSAVARAPPQRKGPVGSSGAVRCAPPRPAAAAGAPFPTEPARERAARPCQAARRPARRPAGVLGRGSGDAHTDNCGGAFAGGGRRRLRAPARRWYARNCPLRFNPWAARAVPAAVRAPRGAPVRLGTSNRPLRALSAPRAAAGGEWQLFAAGDRRRAGAGAQPSLPSTRRCPSS